MNSWTSSSARLLKISNKAILSSLEAAITFWSPTNIAAKTATTLLSIRLLGLILRFSDRLFYSFGDVGPSSLFD